MKRQPGGIGTWLFRACSKLGIKYNSDVERDAVLNSFWVEELKKREPKALVPINDPTPRNDPDDPPIPPETKEWILVILDRDLAPPRSGQQPLITGNSASPVIIDGDVRPVKRGTSGWISGIVSGLVVLLLGGLALFLASQAGLLGGPVAPPQVVPQTVIVDNVVTQTVVAASVFTVTEIVTEVVTATPLPVTDTPEPTPTEAVTSTPEPSSTPAATETPTSTPIPDLFSDSFDERLRPEWGSDPSEWTSVDGQLVALKDDVRLNIGDDSWSNYAVELDLIEVAGFDAIFHHCDITIAKRGDKFLTLYVDGQGNQRRTTKQEGYLTLT